MENLRNQKDILKLSDLHLRRRESMTKAQIYHVYVIYEWSPRSEAAAWCLHCNKKEKVEGETGNKKATIEFYAPC